MQTRTILAILAVLVLSGTPARAEPTFPDDPRGLYTRASPSRDGIGKIYMGREISFTLGHAGVRWLERPERAEEEQPDRLVELLDLPVDATVADIGAGSGYIASRLSEKVPQGRVLAVDIQQEMLDEVRRRAKALDVTNVEPVLGTIRNPNLPEGGVDAVLMVDAYHEFSHPREMTEGILRGLKPGGRVFLVEYRAEDPDVPMLPLHKMTEAQARKELAAAGLEFVENRGGLPWQHLLVFRKP